MDRSEQPRVSRVPLPMARSMCWHCQSEVHGEYFCERCVKVQPLSKELDYFTCLGLPRLLNIDPGMLEARFYEMSRTFHPDFYHNKSESEQSISLGNAALLNTAYRTLKDPFRRAEYLLGLEAGSVKDIRTSPPADLFEEILSLQEDLEEYRTTARGKDSPAMEGLRQRLDRDRRTLEQRREAMELRLFELFQVWDRLQGAGLPDDRSQIEKQAVLKELRDILSNRTYLLNILNDLTATLTDVSQD